MKWMSRLLILAVLVCPALLSQESQTVTHGPDGDAMEMIPSITITAVPNAPFSSVVTTEWVKTLADGSSITRQNHRVVVRHSSGRIFQERRTLVPKDSQAEPQVRQIEISDPAQHTKYFCRPAARECALYPYSGPLVEVAAPAGPSDDGKVVVTRQDLGKSEVSGVEVVGTLEARIIEAGVIGNDRPVSITKEFWYSPKLGLNMVVKRNDPRSGSQILTVTQVSLAEPDPKYFQVPTGFTVKDMRSAGGKDHAATR